MAGSKALWITLAGCGLAVAITVGAVLGYNTKPPTPTDWDRARDLARSNGGDWTGFEFEKMQAGKDKAHIFFEREGDGQEEFSATITSATPLYLIWEAKPTIGPAVLFTVTLTSQGKHRLLHLDPPKHEKDTHGIYMPLDAIEPGEYTFRVNSIGPWRFALADLNTRLAIK